MCFVTVLHKIHRVSLSKRNPTNKQTVAQDEGRTLPKTGGRKAVVKLGVSGSLASVGLTCASLYTISYCWIICLLIWLPWYTIAFISVHVRNSRSQLVMVERGAMMRKGPWIPLTNISERNVMDWMVFPRPISSAKIQFFLQRIRSMSNSLPTQKITEVSYNSGWSEVSEKAL